MNTARTLIAPVGQHARVTLGDVPVIVKIVDTKERYGAVRYQICPLFASDRTDRDLTWVLADRVTLIQPDRFLEMIHNLTCQMRCVPA